jgi:hypothetical protein
MSIEQIKKHCTFTGTFSHSQKTVCKTMAFLDYSLSPNCHQNILPFFTFTPRKIIILKKSPQKLEVLATCNGVGTPLGVLHLPDSVFFSPKMKHT